MSHKSSEYSLDSQELSCEGIENEVIDGRKTEEQEGREEEKALL
jgi:hypothetical protein